MKLVKRNLEKDGSGELKLIATDGEDMWHAFNLIAVGDRLSTTTLRKVVKESSTGSVDSKKVRTNLKIEILAVDFDSEACTIRLSGRNVEENRFVKMGAHHTLEMELERAFTIEKDCWDLIALERIEAACDPAKSAQVAAVMIQPGLANVCLVTTSMTLARGKIELNIPRKRAGASGHSKAMARFYAQVSEALLRHVDFAVVQCVLIAGPGFTRDEFLKHVFDQAVRADNRVLIENKSKFLSCQAASAHPHELSEILVDPAVASKVADTTAAREMRAIEDFYKMLGQDPDRAQYGVKHVAYANEQQAIATLLVTDALFRSNDIATRRRYVELVETAQDNGADVRIFSSLHASGIRLGNCGGVAAILRFPVPEPEEWAGEDSGSDTDSDAGGGGDALGGYV